MSHLTAYECYIEYISLKNHFNTITYDYFKFKHKMKGKGPESFEARRDLQYFVKLSRHPEPIKLMLANFSVNNYAYIGDLVSEDGQKIYMSWKKRIESLSYSFKEELNNLHPDFNENIKVSKGTHPFLIRQYLAGKICLETFIIIVDLTRCYSYWAKELDKDDFIWKEVSHKIVKYKPFLSYNRTKFKDILLSKFKNSS